MDRGAAHAENAADADAAAGEGEGCSGVDPDCASLLINGSRDGRGRTVHLKSRTDVVFDGAAAQAAGLDRLIAVDVDGAA